MVVAAVVTVAEAAGAVVIVAAVEIGTEDLAPETDVIKYIFRLY